MKNLKSILFATAFMIATMSFANTDDATAVSGNYTGTLETKTFVGTTDATQAKSAKDFGIDLMFNGDVFIYQSHNAKAMGTYKLEGDKISFEVTSVKGDENLVKSIFSNEFQFSKKDGQMMLIGNSENEETVTIIHLRNNEAGKKAESKVSDRMGLPVHVYLMTFKPSRG